MGAVSIVLAILLVLVSCLYIWLKYCYNYWRKQNVPYVHPHIIFGNMKEIVFSKSAPAEHFDYLYNHENAQDQPFIGIYVLNKPAILLRDLQLIKQINISDFNKFPDRYSSCNPDGDILGAYNMFFAKNPLWKDIRSQLGAAFSNSRVKQYFTLIDKIGVDLENYVQKALTDPKDGSDVHELKDLLTKYTVDVIASVAFGLQANSIYNKNAEFLKHGKLVFDLTIIRAFTFACVFFFPRLTKLFRLKLYPKSSRTFFRNSINYALTERIKKGETRHDLIDSLISFRSIHAFDESDTIFNQSSKRNDVLVAQAAVFFIAGTETTSSTISVTIFELARHPEIQKRVREEIKEVLGKNGGKCTYELLHQMEYLTQCINEALRKYPPVPFLDRKCTLSGTETHYSFAPYSDYCAPNGIGVYIPVLSIHRDPKYWPDPLKFDPDRFAPENRDSIVPLSYFPFGLGRRNCIGEQIAFVKLRIAIIYLLRRFFIEPCDKSSQELTIKKGSIAFSSETDINCRFVPDPLF